VIARSFGAGTRELVTHFARLEELALERPVLLPQFVLTGDAHNLLPAADSLRPGESFSGECFLAANITPSPSSTVSE
jgi:hypothetical protein